MDETDADEDVGERSATANGIEATYRETERERLLEFTAQPDSSARGTAAIAQNREGYAMLKVRPTADADELERYYGFDMALDHVAELLGVSTHDLPIPGDAEDMGM
ncbi:DUF7111 family protein [Natrarchaeobaculum sulfurireducens]|uniref:Uncharacterized protein n=1 Tax=Natrarchaeobaculum sulfurireducens TaxID=2044521 RepID=A0A346PNI4_9EURY|nr:hypothetical protein [Natrarchaeobaculum sulfurireducens]AXR78875.1 hypothetical protein AArc1_2560 [Natrarchaeobaculum sulfurireducens]AXR81079.1 hypothetical protein AArcMg_1063 [Natrarchaeobaculum sulfurireducens]